MIMSKLLERIVPWLRPRKSIRLTESFAPRLAMDMVQWQVEQRVAKQFASDLTSSVKGELAGALQWAHVGMIRNRGRRSTECMVFMELNQPSLWLACSKELDLNPTSLGEAWVSGLGPSRMAGRRVLAFKGRTAGMVQPVEACRTAGGGLLRTGASR